MESKSRQRPVSARGRIVGLALLASAGVLLLVAVLSYTGIIPVPAEQRPLVAITIVVAALTDAAIGVRLTMASTK